MVGRGPLTPERGVWGLLKSPFPPRRGKRARASASGLMCATARLALASPDRRRCVGGRVTRATARSTSYDQVRREQPATGRLTSKAGCHRLRGGQVPRETAPYPVLLCPAAYDWLTVQLPV